MNKKEGWKGSKEERENKRENVEDDGGAGEARALKKQRIWSQVGDITYF